MNAESRVLFVPESEVRSEVSRLLGQLRTRLGALLPRADIQHVGSTAIPGSLTKGDLDIQVRVSREDYAGARELLIALYSINEGGFAEDDATSFEDYGTQPPHGVHLTVVDGSCDLQWRFRDALIASDMLRREYDELKRRFEGKSMAKYRDAKERFVLRVQASDVYRALTAPRASQLS